MVDIVLGGGRAARRRDSLRGGDLTVQSRYGVHPAERRLIEAIPPRGARILTTLDAEGVVALAAARLHPAATVCHHELDAYRARLSERTIATNGGGVTVVVTADLPGRGVEVAAENPAEERPAVPVPDAEAEPRDAALPPSSSPLSPPVSPPPWDAVLLAGPKNTLLLRDLVEQAHDALRVGGRLFVAADRRAKALVDLVKRVFGAADRQAGERRGVQLFVATRRREAAVARSRVRGFSREVRGLTLSLFGRPGVFGGDGLDRGARALIERMEVEGGARVLDIGAGTGALGFAARHLGAGEVVLVDSDARAVSVARRAALAAGLEKVEVLLRADLDDLPGRFDLALANPPYYGNFRIAEAFCDCAHAHLRPGGRFWLVAKRGAKHAEIVRARFGNAALSLQDGYGIVSARR